MIIKSFVEYAQALEGGKELESMNGDAADWGPIKFPNLVSRDGFCKIHVRTKPETVTLYEYGNVAGDFWCEESEEFTSYNSATGRVIRNGVIEESDNEI